MGGLSPCHTQCRRPSHTRWIVLSSTAPKSLYGPPSRYTAAVRALNHGIVQRRNLAKDPPDIAGTILEGSTQDEVSRHNRTYASGEGASGKASKPHGKCHQKK